MGSRGQSPRIIDLKKMCGGPNEMAPKATHELNGQSQQPADDLPPPHTKRSKKEIWSYRLSLLLGLFVPVFLETIDYTVVATAQPHIASAFNRLDLQSWIGTSYLLTSTVFLPLFASFADIFGRHAALQSSLLLFLFGSALSTGAINMSMMLAGRGIAGVGAAGFLTVTRVILADSRSLDENVIQFSEMMILYSIGYSAGPWIGGALTSINFRFVFGINLPSAAAGMVLIFLFLRKKIKGPQPSVRKRKRTIPEVGLSKISPKKIVAIDFVGAALFIGGFILILLGLNWGSTTSDLSDQLRGHAKSSWAVPRVIASLVAGGFLVIFSILWEYLIERYDKEDKVAPTILLDAEPILPIPVLKNRDTMICNYISLISGMIMFVFFYFVAIFFTIVSGQDPKQAGGQLVFFAPGVGGGVYLSIFLIKIFRRPKWPVVLGPIVLTISLGLVSMAIRKNSTAMIDGFMSMAGIGVGLTVGPTSIHCRISQSVKRIAVFEGLQLFFLFLGGTVGLAQCATVMDSKITSGIGNLIKTGVLPISAIQNVNSIQSSSAEGIVSIQQINLLPLAEAEAIRDVFRDGIRWAFLSLIPWAGIAAILSAFLSNVIDPDEERKRQKKKEEKKRRDQLIGRGDEYAILGPKPQFKIYHGLGGLIIYFIRLKKWNKQKAEIDSRRVAGGNLVVELSGFTSKEIDQV